MPDFSGFVEAGLSSATILCVRGLGFGRAGTTAPALRVKSDRKDSLSDANLNNALSKSNSPEGVDDLLGDEVAFIVMLLRLLFVPFDSTDRIDIRASLDNFENRL
jgi:hypothetical protein